MKRRRSNSTLQCAAAQVCQFIIGQHVLAKWTDRKFYAGTITDIHAGNNFTHLYCSVCAVCVMQSKLHKFPPKSRILAESRCIYCSILFIQFNGETSKLLFELEVTYNMCRVCYDMK